MLSADNVFARFDGAVNGADHTSLIPISLSPDNFGVSGGSTLVAIKATAPAGSALDPALVGVRDANNQFAPRRFADPDQDANRASTVIVELSHGDYVLEVGGERGTSGAYELALSLIGDTTGDYRVGIVDIVQVRNLFGAQAGDGQYVVAADANLDGRIMSLDLSFALRNQFDSTAVRPLTTLTAALSEPRNALPGSDTVFTNEAVHEVRGTTLPGAAVSVDINCNGMFGDGSTVADDAGNFALPLTLTEGMNHVLVRASDSFGQRRTAVVRAVLDTVAPVIASLDLAAATDSAPRGDLHTIFDAAELIGQTEPNSTVQLLETATTSTADSLGRFVFSGVPLSVGANVFTVVATDTAGNQGSSTVVITRQPQAADAIVLREGESFVVERRLSVALGQSVGSRTLSIDLDAMFDVTDQTAAVEDTFLIYLVDPTNPSQTLLDRGQPGTALFALSSGRAEFTPGLVRYDGHTIEVDLTSLASLTQGELVLQLINSDADTGTTIQVHPPGNAVDEDGAASPVLKVGGHVVPAGSAVDVAPFATSSDLEPIISNIRMDAAGRYTSELRLLNNGPRIGRNAVVLFPGLPPAVTLTNPSGVDSSGVPYLNLRNALRSGGLGTGESSDTVLLEFENPTLARFAIRPVILTRGANQPPQFAPLGPLSVMPGGTLSVTLDATDDDGDMVTFSIRSNDVLPQGLLEATGKLTFTPQLDELGTYSFELIASDGAAETRHQVTLNVVADPISVTRISGVVKNTLDQPLDGVPIEIAGFSAVTAADGSFTIALPTMLVPTESFNIPIPAGDPLFDPFNTGTQEIRLRRARHDVTTSDSTANPRQHPNLVSSFLDAGVVYGFDSERAAALRTFADGKLKTSAGNLLPLNDSATFPDGPLENDNEGRLDPATLFAAGDVRTNENVPLIALHTLLVREHNRLADEIKAANPGFSDEQIYQHARRMVGGIIQHITYSEYLPLLLGVSAIPAYAGYDSSVNPNESAMFAAAAFRVGHTQLFSEIQRLDASGQSLAGGPLSLQNAFFTPQPIVDDGIEPFLRGLAASQAQEIDIHVIDDVRNFLFGPPGAGGMDLPALNIQRGRDMGLPSYNRARQDFGLFPVSTFAEISSNPAVQAALQTAYGNVDAIDIWVGGVAEDHAPGAQVGPLFQRIIADQFRRTRDGDRFWYENAQFTTDELAEIRGTTLRDLILRNTAIAPSELPPNVFTTGDVVPGRTPGGSPAANTPAEFRKFDGRNNNLADSTLGSTGAHVLQNFTLAYGDGISSPAGADRPGARAISNAVNAQSDSIPNAAGATGFVVFWGQIIDHDLGLTPGGVSDTLRILGHQRPDPNGDESYPFVAERMDLMLGRPVYPGVDNVIARPIYLPELDVENGTPIDPAEDIVVFTPYLPGAAVTVDAHTLKDRQGNDFSGALSITEVPRDLTPAVLPEGMFPDLVVTVQPADMVFTTPAPLSLPNLAGYPVGTAMDLWSINPITGFFDDVGDGIVVDNDGDGFGDVIDTVTGGIRNSSWHFFVPPPTTANDPGQNGRNKENGCDDQPASECVGSRVELHAGTYHEWHDLPTYQSLGVSRGVSLHYDSLRADPRPIIHFDYSNVRSGADQRLTAALSIGPATNGFQDLSTRTADHYWSIPDGGLVNIDAAIQADLSGAATGRYRYQINSGVLRYTPGRPLFGTMSPQTTGTLLHVNSTSSPLGAGWGIAGLQEIVVNADDSVLLIDGDGSEMLFGAPAMLDRQPRPVTFLSPPGDFSKLELLADGTYRRTLKDQTVYQFNADHELASVTDRNGNATRYEYAGNIISKIIDPVGLETTFMHEGGKVTAITDPAGRTTRLEYDGAGNLVRVVDPDQSTRAWEYDARHLLTAEVDQRGNREQTFYDFAGRLTHSITKDGAEIRSTNAQTVGLFPPEQTASPDGSPTATLTKVVDATFVDANGRVLRTVLDQAGQLRSAVDSVGAMGSVVRDSSNLASSARDGRRFRTEFQYDPRGNVTRTSQTLGDPSTKGPLFPGESYGVGNGPRSAVAVDLNADGYIDIVAANESSDDISILLGKGDGTFDNEIRLAVGDFPTAVVSSDFNGDGIADLATANSGSRNLSVLLGFGDGTFDSLPPIAVGEASLGVLAMATADFNNDGIYDIATANAGSHDVAVFYGRGDGTFVLIRRVPVGSLPVFIVTADVNGDGIVDLATANSGSNTVSIRLGRSDGTYTPQDDLLTSEVPVSIAAGDFDGDNRVDLVVANRNSDNVTVYYGRGNGAFTALNTGIVGDSPVSVATGDFNGDGLDDFVTANRFSTDVSVVLARAGRTLEIPRRFPVYNYTAAVVAADFDNDGVSDVASIGSNRVMVSLSLGNGDLFALRRRFLGRHPSSIVAADFNGDTISDLAVNTNGVSVLVGLGDAAFAAPRATAIGRSPQSLATADFNGDDIADLATANAGTDVSVLLGQGDGTFSVSPAIAVGAEPRSIVAADFNGDGLVDLATANFESNDVSVLLGNGDGTFAAQQRFGAGSRPQAVAVGDFNGDSILDLATASRDSNGVSILLGNGDGTFTLQPQVSAGLSPSSIAVADFNDDGISDLAMANYGSNDVAFVLGNRSGVFTLYARLAVGTRPTSVISGDFNGDGLADLAVANEGLTHSDISILINSSDGSFSSERRYALGSGSLVLASGDMSPPTSPQAIIADDFDGNGVADLATANSRSDNNVSVLLGNEQSRSAAVVATRSFTYDPTFSQITSITDELGHVTNFDIDPANGNRLSTTRVIGAPGGGDDLVTRYTYTAAGQIDTMTDPNGRVTDYDYDPFGRLVAIVSAKGTADEATRRFEYDMSTVAGRAGLVTASIDENGRRSEFVYDVMNRLVRTIEPDPNGPALPLRSPETNFHYDPAGNLVSTVDARGVETRYEYDAMSRRVRTIDADPDGPAGPATTPITKFSYDIAGNLVAIVDALGHVTEHRYDARDRRIETIDPDGGRTTFRYDLDNNLTAVIDPVGNRTNFAYDQRNRMTRETDPLGKATIYTYDPADRLILKTDRNGRKTRYEYDDADRLIKETWQSAAGSTENVIHYAYDAAGNLLSLHDNQSSLVYAYDARNRVQTVDNRGSEAVQGTPGAPRVVLNYAYDAVGNVLSVVDTINGGAGATTGYQYDALDRLITLTQAGPGLADKRVDFAYNPLGQYQSIQRYRDLAATQLVVGTSYLYDSLNRLDVMRHQNAAGETLNFHDLDYDTASRITRITDIDGTHDYSYDDRDQLTGANHTAPGGSEFPNLPDEFYQYDANGNRLASHLHGMAYVTGPGNRLLSDGTYDYEYDHEGNTTKRTRITDAEPDGSTLREFSWDNRNRLVAVIDKKPDGTPTQIVRFTYDGIDRRISKAVDTTPTDAVDAAILHFINDREDVILDYLDADGAGPAAPTLSQRYLHGPAIDQVLAQDNAVGTIHWHLTDHLGTVNDLAAQNGQLAAHDTYDSFGHVLEQPDGHAESRYKFTGRESDDDVHLQSSRNRYYYTTAGRFLSRDTIGFRAGDTNLFRYVSNRPVEYVDPFGHDATPPAVPVPIPSYGNGTFAPRDSDIYPLPPFVPYTTIVPLELIETGTNPLIQALKYAIVLPVYVFGKSVEKGVGILRSNETACTIACDAAFLAIEHYATCGTSTAVRRTLLRKYQRFFGEFALCTALCRAISN